MTTLAGAPLVVLRGSFLQRLMGWWICAIAVIGPIALAWNAGLLAAVVVTVLWSTPALWWGWRVAHLGVVAGREELVVRNPLRTHRIPYDTIEEIRVRRRSPAGRPGDLVRALWNPAVGVVEVRGRDQPVQVKKTETLVSGGRRPSWLGRRTANQVDQVRSAWLERAAS